ncbi:MAG: hypothetical protein ACRBCJ_03465 [Hyphomicrobiaceae bacterium]
MEKKIENTAERLESTATTVEDAVDVVQEAAARVETNVTHGIQPDINELRINISELNQTADIRQKRLLWAMWVLIAINLITLFVVFTH